MVDLKLYFKLLQHPKARLKALSCKRLVFNDLEDVNLQIVFS